MLCSSSSILYLIYYKMVLHMILDTQSIINREWEGFQGLSRTEPTYTTKMTGKSLSFMLFFVFAMVSLSTQEDLCPTCKWILNIYTFFLRITLYISFVLPSSFVYWWHGTEPRSSNEIIKKTLRHKYTCRQKREN